MKIYASYSPSPVEISALLDSARRLYLQAREEGAAILKKSRKQAATVLLKKRDSGYRAGFEEGCQRSLEAIGEYRIKAQNEFNESLQIAKKECLDLAVQIAEQIMESQLRCNRTSISRRITKAISQIVESRALTVIVCSKDKKLVEDILSSKFPARSIKILQSDEVESGNAIIRTVAGDTELNWRHHLNLIKKALLGIDLNPSMAESTPHREKPLLVAVK